MNKQELIENLAKRISPLEDFRGISGFHDGNYEGLEYALNLIQQLDEPQKPVVPKCAEPFLEKSKYSTDVIDLFSEVEYATDSDGFIDSKWRWSGEFYDWLVEDSDTLYILCDALRYGYEVEKEPEYYVRLPFEVWDKDAAELKTEYFYLHYDITSDETRLFTTKEPMKDFATKLDEATIKSADEKYWAFAVPVEEVVEG